MLIHPAMQRQTITLSEAIAKLQTRPTASDATFPVECGAVRRGLGELAPIGAVVVVLSVAESGFVVWVGLPGLLTEGWRGKFRHPVRGLNPA